MKFTIKKIIEFIIVVLENIGIPIAVVYLVSQYIPKSTIIGVLERLSLYTIIYQVFLFILNKVNHSTYKDMLLAYIRQLKLVEIALNSDDDYFIDQSILELDGAIEEFKKGKYSTSDKFIELLILLRDLVLTRREDALIYVQKELINAEHGYNMIELDWFNSIILNKLK